MADDHQYSKEETERRFVAAIRASRIIGHKSRDEMKLGQPRAKARPSLKKSTRKKPSK